MRLPYNCHQATALTLLSNTVFFRSDVGHMFALSWLITWFAHVINDPDSIFRIFDFFLGTHPLMPIYLGAAVSRNALR